MSDMNTMDANNIYSKNYPAWFVYAAEYWLQKHVLERAPIGFFLIDSTGTVRGLNQSASQLVGITTKNLKGRKFNTFLVQADRARFVTYLADIKAACKPGMQAFGLYQDAAQSRTSQIRLFPLLCRKSGQGRCVFLLLITQGDTEPSDLRHLPDRCLQYQQDVLATVSHEVQNPLGAICNAAEVIRRKGGQDPDMLSWGCRVIRQQASQISGLLKNVLDMTRISLGSLPLIRQPVRLQTLLNQLLALQPAFLAEHGKSIILTTPSASLWLAVDLARYTQIITNLLQIAAKFTLSRKDIQVSVHTRPGWCGVCVRGYYAGGADEQRIRLTQLTPAANDPLPDFRGSLDITLILTRKLAEAHGGYIEVSDVTDPEPSATGCPVLEFRLWLPVYDRATT
jgi:signal transduction histidine kinase